MSDLRILVIEDAQNWQEALPKILRQLGDNIRVEVAAKYSAALRFITNKTYDLAIVDLSLPDAPAGGSEQRGMQLLRELRNSRSNQRCGLIVLTGDPSTENTRQAFRDYRVHDFIDKSEFDAQRFVESARKAIRDARLEHAAARANTRYLMTVTFSQERLVSSELTGPDRRSRYIVPNPAPFDVVDLARRTTNLDLLIRYGGVEVWRPEARSIGDAIYRVLASDQSILGDLGAARAVTARQSDFWLQFSGPAIGLGLPFELVRDANDYFGLSHILTRQLAQPGSSLARKTEAFHSFLENLLKHEETLRILVVGANSDGNIPVAKEEAEALAAAMKTDLQQLDIDCDITLLLNEEATYEQVSSSLRDGHYHIFHYAGHSRANAKVPEMSGLVLPDDDDLRTLTATDLNLYLRDTNMHLVFLSSCLGARTAMQAGRGDFYGPLESLARADVPVVLGHRWTVTDHSAMHFALAFYRMLWRTFSPGEALLQARRAIATGEQGRDDETWASPVLLMQNV